MMLLDLIGLRWPGRARYVERSESTAFAVLVNV